METEAQIAVTGKRNWKKVGLITAGVLVVLCVFLGWAYWYYSVQAVDRDPQKFSTKAQWVLWGMGMKQAYVSDNYGGNTPEETLAMYISALEMGDVGLASKYYIPEKWKEKEQKLLVGQKNGVLPTLINMYKQATSGEQKEGGYFFWIDDGEAKFHLRLVVNEYTNKWKIVEP